jgi:hypothetical protein
VILGTRGGSDAAIEAAVEVARLDGRDVPGGEQQPGLGPAITSPSTVSVLPLPADLECETFFVDELEQAIRKRTGWYGE